MAGMRIGVHHAFGLDFGPASRFVPPQMEIKQQADNGGGRPVEPNALCFIEPDSGEMHVFVVSDEMRTQIVAALTGGIVIAGGDT